MKNRTVVRLAIILMLIGISLAPGIKTARGEMATVFWVDSTGDESDVLNEGRCFTALGTCTLRAAMQQAKNTSGLVEIRFNLPAGPFVIAPLTNLPSTSNASILGPNLSGDRIILDGNNTTETGLYFDSATSPLTVTGLQIQNFVKYGIFIDFSDMIIGGAGEADRNVIIGNGISGIQVAPRGIPVIDIRNNFIGVDETGSTASPNGDGIDIFGTSSVNAVVNIQSNVISGNLGWGISFSSCTKSGSSIYGNRIGTDFSGTAALPNGSGGIRVLRSSGIQIGSGAAGMGNQISGNSNYGILITDSSTNITVQGNRFSLNAAQTACLANYPSDLGVEKSTANLVGGDNPGDGNVFMQPIYFDGVDSTTPADNNVVKNNRIGIADSGLTRRVSNGSVGLTFALGNNNLAQGNTITHFDYGVRVASGIGNQISQNSIFENRKLGIDLGFNQVTLNDPLDPDSGPNNLMNFPVITTVDIRRTPLGKVLDISGTLNTCANRQILIELFNSPRCHSSGYGEGKAYLGALNVSTDVNGDAAWVKTDLPFLPEQVGFCITATATEVVGLNTSEFSAGFEFGQRLYLPLVVR